MTKDADDFSIQLLEEAKRFLEKAVEEPKAVAYLHAALIVGFSALESHLNAVAEEIAAWDVTLLDQSVLLEREVRLDAGSWALGEARFFRLEERIKFVMIRFGEINATERAWWSDLMEGTKVRNGLVHPRRAMELSTDLVTRYLQAILDALDDLYLAVFKKGHPSHGRGLQSTTDF